MIYSAVPAYQLGVNNVCLTGEILMAAGLPGKCAVPVSLQPIITSPAHTCSRCRFMCLRACVFCAVKFYTLDDCLMFTLRRVVFPGAPSPMSKRFRDKFSVSTTALQDLAVDDDCACAEEPDKPAPAVRSHSTSAIPAFSPDQKRFRPPPLPGILKHT